MKGLALNLILVLLITGCATTTGRRGLRSPVNGDPSQAQTDSVQSSSAQHCPDRINRARAGGTVGSVVGLIAASAINPLFGLLYQIAGYGVGFASADTCKKDKDAAATAQAPNGAASAPVKIAADKLGEEDLK